MGILNRLFHREILTDGEIDLVKVMEVTEDDEDGMSPCVMFEIKKHGESLPAGRCDLRMGMNEELYYAGQIGYTIYPKFRGNHYALKACRILFDLAREKYQMNRLIITCNPDNLPSRKTLEALGGTLVEIADVPESHYCYRQGEFQKCIFEYKL